MPGRPRSSPGPTPLTQVRQVQGQGPVPSTLYKSPTSLLRGHILINIVRKIAQSALEGLNVLYKEGIIHQVLGVLEGVVWGFCEGWGWFGFRFEFEFQLLFEGGQGGWASGVKVAKEGKRRVKGRLGSRAEDASLVLGFGASLSIAEHSFGPGFSVDYGDDTAGADVGSDIVDFLSPTDGPDAFLSSAQSSVFILFFFILFFSLLCDFFTSMSISIRSSHTPIPGLGMAMVFGVGFDVGDASRRERIGVNLKRDVGWYIAHSKIVSTPYLHSKNNITNGSWIIASYGAYLQEPNIRMCMEWIEKINHEKDIETSNSSFSIIHYRHIKLCDFGVSGDLVFIYMNTFAGTSVYIPVAYRSIVDMENQILYTLRYILCGLSVV
ncbi:hypothetical protein D9758_017302 [Tetrapyrgos nigripes]|uniref:Uncharacterized protein n=1 Tax=Tetrapyrgos nigripes TaxID=182062 RepID=A0A8H5C0S2_9AGAR|nr:hypothetical protein D9758_017302 [Tetrapyrgos nigripes]